MAETIKVTIDGKITEYEKGIECNVIAKEYEGDGDNPIMQVYIGNKLRELSTRLNDDCTIRFIRFTDRIGYETYRRSVVMLFLQACHHVLGPDKYGQISILNSIGDAYYAELDMDKEQLNSSIKDIKDYMYKVVEEDHPFLKSNLSKDEAIERFDKYGMNSKKELFSYRMSSHVNIYNLNGYEDYFYGFMAPSTGCLKYFDLFKFGNGLLLQFPKRQEPTVVREFVVPRKFVDICNKQREFVRNLGVSTVAGLNEMICKGKGQEMMLIAESWQEKEIADIASMIADKPSVKFVMIAGPSSSGKTTFSHRLSIQLMARGKTPHAIALDDYFVDRELTPLDENGNLNFECLEALDVEQFNKDMTDLLNGKTVNMPSFNFKTGKREYKDDYLTLGSDDILVIEGIHGLNDKLSYSLDKDSKFKIYISALTQINLDEHNRISTTDGRLIRRIVRDSRTRGSSARDTIAMWESVRAGEENNIFPFQESADAMFNSSLVFELSVLKMYVQPQLFAIKPDEPTYYEAKRLLKFLDYFVGIPSEVINNNSIIREFIGGSCFKV